MIVLVRHDPEIDHDVFLGDDFETWTPELAKAKRFTPGAALNACVERWRRHGAICAKVDE